MTRFRSWTINQLASAILGPGIAPDKSIEVFDAMVAELQDDPDMVALIRRVMAVDRRRKKRRARKKLAAFD